MRELSKASVPKKTKEKKSVGKHSAKDNHTAEMKAPHALVGQIAAAQMFVGSILSWF